MTAFNPVIKWFGSKRNVANKLSLYFPTCNTYFEPFVGGGAMLPFAKANIGVAGDIIPELIDLWIAIKEQPLIVAEEYQKRWEKLQCEGPDIYYQIRDNFNRTKNCYDFLFLTRTCVNGMIRYNNQGEFNNSLHLTRPGISPIRLKPILMSWNLVLKHFYFKNLDYRETLSNVKTGDFVFLDPPYGGTKDRYTKNEFNLTDFYNELERLNSLGVKWMLTFDGSAGSRKYNYNPPLDTYKTKFTINTGFSAFSKVMENKNDQIIESVYLNFDSPHNDLNLFQNF